MNKNVISEQRLCGLDEADVVEVPHLHCRLHNTVVQPLLKLCDSARDAGFCLQVASSYRSFERQLQIWNSKAKGVRPVLDTAGQPLVITDLTERELLFAILRWSALPGSSRHHWGSDLDIYDSSRIASDYALQLTVQETQGDGPFAPFHQWLTHLLAHDGFGFYRPYIIDSGGVAPEPWHISYAPLAQEFSDQFSEDILRRQVQASDILLKQVILENLTEIYQRFVRVKR